MSLSKIILLLIRIILLYAGGWIGIILNQRFFDFFKTIFFVRTIDSVHLNRRLFADNLATLSILHA